MLKNIPMADILTPQWIAILLSVIALLVSWYSLQNSRKLAHQHISPEIRVSLTYPLSATAETHAVKRASNPQLAITNVGAIRIASLMVEYEGYLYDKTKQIIFEKITLGNEAYPYVIYKDSLQVAETVKASLVNVDNTNIGIFILKIKFYRDTDMQEYSQSEYFFVDNDAIYTHGKYRQMKDYRAMMYAVRNYDPRHKTGSLGFQVIGENTWALTKVEGAVFRKPDGRGVLSMPYEIEYICSSRLNRGRPLLFIEPSRFRDTNKYIKTSTIDDDIINVDYVLVITNIGDRPALRMSSSYAQGEYARLDPEKKNHVSLRSVLTRQGDPRSARKVVEEAQRGEYLLSIVFQVTYYDELVKYSINGQYSIGYDRIKLDKYVEDFKRL